MQDFKVHTRQKHIENVKATKEAAVSTPIDSLFKPGPSKPTTTKMKLAELRLAAHIAVHSSLCTSDHPTSVVKNAFRDSSVADERTLERTKCTALIT